MVRISQWFEMIRVTEGKNHEILVLGIPVDFYLYWYGKIMTAHGSVLLV